MAPRKSRLPPSSRRVAYVASLIGADRVCLNSDHGAVRFDIPGFEDCTKFPVVTQAQKGHGFSDTEVRSSGRATWCSSTVSVRILR
jgi:microsomal dipeptidase-like Zn-dependent dipeptidase